MKILKFLFLMTLLGILLLPTTLSAEEKNVPIANKLIEQQNEILKELGSGGYGEAKTAEQAETDLASKIGSVAGIVLSFLGVIYLFYVVYAGIQWMTAGGNEQQVENARDRIVRATIGMVIVVSAWGISSFIITKIQSKNNIGANERQISCDELNPQNAYILIYSCMDYATCIDSGGTVENNGTCVDKQICCYAPDI